MTEGLRWQITKAVRASDLPAPARLIMLPNIRPAWKRDGHARTGIVYYLQRENGDVKIGTTINYPNRRSKHRRFGRLALVALEAGYFELEAERHRQFAHLRVDPVAEWFRLGDDLLDHILLLLALR